ncbi:Ribonuclease HI [Alteromonadaceae bacterium Bs31]|nr:Ribonuclease HI [Alteromonadaceae bacterium Bs31]
MILFTDGSVHAASGIGYGACLWVEDCSAPIDTVKSEVQLKQFRHTSSSRLELQALLWALGDWLENHAGEQAFIECYTDSQTIVALPQRRAKLEANNFCSNKGVLLSNADLYQQFYALMDNIAHKNIPCKLIKIAGHQAQKNKTPLDHLFTLVDKAARNAVRNIA